MYNSATARSENTMSKKQMVALYDNRKCKYLQQILHEQKMNQTAPNNIVHFPLFNVACCTAKLLWSSHYE